MHKQKHTDHAHRKHQGLHQRRTKHFMKVYWPYLPLVLIVSAGLLFGTVWRHKELSRVLGYATNISNGDLLQAANQKRQANGKGTLVSSTQLNSAAQAKANDMATRNYWSHNTPEGNPPWAFIDQAGYKYQKAGENLAYGFLTSQDVTNGWMNSPYHRENLLDAAYSEVGFGIAGVENYQNSGPETIVVAMYAQRSGAETVATATRPTNPPITTLQATVKEPASQAISRIQTMTGGKLPWLTFVTGLVSGMAAVWLVLKHSLSVRRFIVQGERFVLQHAVLDLTFIAFIMLVLQITRAAGVIR